MGFTLTVGCDHCDERYTLASTEVEWGSDINDDFLFSWKCPGCKRSYYEE